MAKDKKDKKDRKEKKPKKDRKEKKRKRDSSDSEDSDDDANHKKARAEKLAQKIAKHLGQTATAGYTDQDNPFGDANLTARFVWTKKIEKELQHGASVKEFSRKAEHVRQEERMQEIEKVKKRREERESDRVRMEEELSLVQRERAVMEGIEAEAQEDKFHLEQAQVRAGRRLREGRPKPSDFLARNLHLLGEFEPDPREPYTIFENLLLDDMRGVHDEVSSWKELDKYDPDHVEFWSHMLVIADHELAEAEGRELVDRAHMRGGAASSAYGAAETGLQRGMDQKIESMLTGQSYSQLYEMEQDITHTLEAGEGDPEYWEAVLKRLKIHKSRARLRELNAKFVRRHVDKMLSAVNVREAMGWDREQAEEDAAAPQEQATDDGEAREKSVPRAASEEPCREGPSAAGHGRTLSPTPGTSRAGGEDEGADEDESDDDDFAYLEQSDGRFSPAPVDPLLVAGQNIVDEDDDLQMMQLMRQQVQLAEAAKIPRAAALAAASRAAEADRDYHAMIEDAGARPSGVHPMMRNITDAAPQMGEVAFRSGRAPALAEDAETRGMRAAAMKLMGDNDVLMPFGGEVQLESQVFWWHEKYRPRRPRYFNRVHTGYEWNKYNQTHYDHDNPPPKVVQGYKFNIFYPDLIDKVVAPTWKTEPDPTSPDGTTCVLRFSAGPPYEDVAFRIVNKEWEYSHKKGYKSTFERGILHLYFNFKRQRYRR